MRIWKTKINHRKLSDIVNYTLVFAVINFLSTGIAQAANSLDFADFKATDNGAVEITLSLSDKAPTPQDFTSKNPARISLSLSNTSNNLPWKLPLPIEVSGVNSIQAIEENGRTRVDIDMNALSPYRIKTSGNSITIIVDGDGSGKNTRSAPKPEQVKPAAAQTPAPQAEAIVSAPIESAPQMEEPQAEPEPEPVTTLAAVAPEPAPRPRTMAGSSGATSQLRQVSFNKVPGDKVQIKISFSNSAVEPGSFTINNPARIALDFPNTVNTLGWKSKNIGLGFAKSMTIVEAGNRTRVIINLVSLIPFETQVAGRDVFVTLAGTRTASDSGVPTATNISTAVPGDQTVYSITNIDFRRGAKGEGRVVVTLSDPNTPASSGESGQQIFVDFGNTGLPQDLQQRLDVTDFATPVRFIDTTKVGNRVRLAITPQGDYEYLAYHAGNIYTIEVKQAEKEEKKDGKIDDKAFTGEKLSLNFQDIEVRAVLQLIADFTDLNMVTSDSVRGNLTLRLKNVPWDQALDIVLKTKGLAMRRNGNVILVAPSEEVAAREKLELEAKNQLEKLEPLNSELIQINYANAKSIAGILKDKSASVMSERGSTTIDERTNTILVVDTADKLDAVKKLVAKLDIPVKQVLIESRIVIADNSFAKDLGVRFGVTANGNEDTLVTTTGSLEGTDTIVSQAIDNGGTPLPIPTIPPAVPQRLNVNLPASGSPGKIALSILGSNTLLDLELSALQSEGRGEVISNPRVVTANSHEAYIQQGTQIPYQEASSSGATSVSFKEAVLGLKVTPLITPDDRIFLDLAVNKDSVGAIFAGVPSINTKEVKTQVLVKNGDTVVLGGVYEQETNNSVTRVPFFGDLPLIGALFRSTSNIDNKSELLIFVTPKILKDGLTESAASIPANSP